VIPRWAYAAAGGLFVAVAGLIGALGFAYGALEDTAPEQPVAFSHVRHVGEVGLDCEHCHEYADKGPRATVPAMSICADCHEGMETENPEVKKLQGYLKRNEPVPWVKVHDLPWHALFNHKRHVRAGVECATCHGQLETMERVRRVRSLEMGWCVNCHRNKGAPTDCWTCHK